MSLLSIQWGNTLWPMVVIWILGAVIVWRVGRLHISATYVASFLLLSLVRSAVTGNPWLASVAPITGPMYQLFIFFMVTDPKTTVRSKRGPDARRLPRRVGGDAPAADGSRLRAVLRAVPRRPGVASLTGERIAM